MQSRVFERICDTCGERVPDEADTVCVRCGAPLPQTTPTSVYAPPPELVAKWKEAPGKPPLPAAGSARTLIGLIPPKHDGDPDTDPADGPRFADYGSRRAQRLAGAVVPPVAPPLALSATDTELTAAVADEAEGLPTMPIERLPSYRPAPVCEPAPNAALAATQRQIAPSRSQAQAKAGNTERGLADTLPPPLTSPVEGVALSQLRTEPEAAFPGGGLDADVTPPPLADDMLPQGAPFDAFDELSSPEASSDGAHALLSRSPSRAAPSVASSRRDPVGRDLAPEPSSETTANVGAHTVDLGDRGVSPWLLGLWVVAIAATVAAILVVALR